MAYKFSERHNQDAISAANNNPNKLNLGVLASVFMLFAFGSFATAWVFSMEAGVPYVKRFTDFKPYSNNVYDAVKDEQGRTISVARKTALQKPSHIIGPLNVNKNNVTYEIKVNTSLPSQSWAFIEGQVLDAQKEFLFGFGKELWHESGRDSEGAWREAVDDFSMKVTFPKAGKYYLQFLDESNKDPLSLDVTITRKYGSSLPHFWLGIVFLLIGILLHNSQHGTFAKWVNKLAEANNEERIYNTYVQNNIQKNENKWVNWFIGIVVVLIFLAEILL